MTDSEENIMNAFSTHVKQALTRAMCFVLEQDLKSIEPQHLLWAIGTQKGSIAAELLKKGEISTADLRTIAATSKAKTTKKTNRARTGRTKKQQEPQLHAHTRTVLEKAILTANAHEHPYVGTEHVLSGLLQSPNRMIQTFFSKKSKKASIEEQLLAVLKSMTKFPELTESLGDNDGRSAFSKKSESTPAIDFFGRDLTAAARQDAIDPLIGRVVELERMMEILCRRTKNNPLLLGDPGVGKTALAEGLAQRIASGSVPQPLEDKRIIALDLTQLIAGTMYRGEFEGRLRQIIDEAKGNTNVILFIDEIHTMIGAGSAAGSLDAANILKPALSRGEIRCIGATTFQEYKKGFEADPALERRFQTIDIPEPSEEEAIRILKGLSSRYTDFHNLEIAEGVIEEIVRGSIRYLPSKRLPDKAIDILDEVASHLRVRSLSNSSETEQRLRSALKTAEASKKQAVAEERFLEAVAHKETEEELRLELQAIKSKNTGKKKTKITLIDVQAGISRITGIPLEGSAKHNLNTELKKQVVAQDAAVDAVSAALMRARAMLHDPQRPIASFLFLGPSGVGKTHLAKTIAGALFGDPTSVIRLDMSEYSEGSSLSKLVGAPAGYIGYRESAKLTDQIKRKPHSVVIFDEIEKAHRDVQQILLQILEEGELSDATGRPISFRHAVVVLTSNIGAERLRGSELGFSVNKTNTTTPLNDLEEELRERLKPEIIQRLDKICVFSPLLPDALAEIVDRELQKVADRLQQNRNVRLVKTIGISKTLAGTIKESEGARGARRVVEEKITSPLSEYVIANKPKNWIKLHSKKDGTFSFSSK